MRHVFGVLIGLATLFSPDDVVVSGVVTDASGVPLPGARVFSMSRNKTTTDREGRFELRYPEPLAGLARVTLLRVSLSGYRPRTATMSELAAPIALAPSDVAEWHPPICAPDAALTKPQMFGSMRFAVPKGARVRHGADVDYSEIVIGYRGGWVHHGGGLSWGDGLPFLDDWRALASVEERDVVTPWDSPAAEYRGVRKDGTYWRFVGQFGETVSYSGVSKAVAAHLDRIVDSLCWFDRRAAGKRP